MSDSHLSPIPQILLATLQVCSSSTTKRLKVKLLDSMLVAFIYEQSSAPDTQLNGKLTTLSHQEVDRFILMDLFQLCLLFCPLALCLDLGIHMQNVLNQFQDLQGR